MNNREYGVIENGRKSCTCQKGGETVRGSEKCFRYFKSKNDAKTICMKCYNKLNIEGFGFSVDTDQNAVTTKNHVVDVFVKGGSKKDVVAMLALRFNFDSACNCGKHGFRLRADRHANYMTSALVKANGILTEGLDIVVKVDGIEVHNPEEVNAITKKWAK